MTDILIDYIGRWGLGDLLCSDPMVDALIDRHGPGTRVFLRGRPGNVIHNPLVSGMATEGQSFDRTIEVKLFHHMSAESYGELEAMPSLIGHMLSYAGLPADGRRPRLHLRSSELAAREALPRKRRPRIAICADHLDPLRHWPVERYAEVARILRDAGAEIVEVGVNDRLGVGIDLVGRLGIRETAAALSTCDLFVGNNSGLFHYAQAADVPCVTLFSLATPSRFVHPGASVRAVQAEGLPCLDCMTRCFAAMQRTGCIASPRGRCMTDIPLLAVLDAIDEALAEFPRQAARARNGFIPAPVPARCS